MNRNVVFAVMRRDLRSWFSNPTGYIFIVLFVALACLALMWVPAFFQNNLANLETLNGWFPAMMVLFVPAVTMGMWTSERFNGTQELLFTLPAHEGDVLIGKFLAALGVFTMSLVFTLPLPVALSFLGSPDWGQVFANYVGYWLLGAMLLPVGMLGSQLTLNQAVAFILGAIFVGAVEYTGWLLSLLTGSDAWNQNGPLGQFNEFARGMLPASGLLLFLGFMFAFLQLNLALLTRRHWRTGEEGLHGGVRFASLGIGAVALTVIGVNALPRVDATFERIHSLGQESRKLLASLEPNRPVVVTAYISEDVPEEYAQQRRVLLNLLDQFHALGHGALERRVEFVTPYSPEARRAEKDYGIRAQPVRSQDVGGNVVESQLLLGFVVQSGTEEVVVPFVEVGLPLEYELTRSIRVVANAARKRIGVLRTDVELGGGFDMQTYRPKPRWQFYDELQQQYKVDNVDPDQDYDKDATAEPAKAADKEKAGDKDAASKPKKEPLACLIVPQPSSLTQEQLDRLKNWILAGHPTLLLEDPFSFDAPGTAADDPKGGTRSAFGGGGGPQKGDINGFLGTFALAMAPRTIVWDTSSQSLFGGQLPLEFVFARDAGISQDSPITRGLQSVVVLMGGVLNEQKRDGLAVAELLSSRPRQGESPNGTVPKFESAPGRRDGVLVWDPFGSPGFNPYPDLQRENRPLPLAMRVSGKPAGQEHGVELICIADLDVIGNQFFELRRKNQSPNLRFDNVPFVLNCIDTLAGDDSLVELRKRRPVLRKLTTVEQAQTQYEDAWTRQQNEAEKQARDALEKAQARLDEAVKKVREDKDLDDQAKETNIARVEAIENRRLDLEKARIEDDKRARIEEAAHVRDTARRGIYNRYRWLTIGLSILPALGVGIATFVRRRAREAAIVPQNRMVTGGAR